MKKLWAWYRSLDEVAQIWLAVTIWILVTFLPIFLPVWLYVVIKRWHDLIWRLTTGDFS